MLAKEIATTISSRNKNFNSNNSRYNDKDDGKDVPGLQTAGKALIAANRVYFLVLSKALRE